MRLWVVTYCLDYENTWLGNIRVFSTEEKARAYIEANPPTRREESYDIGVVELDGEPVKGMEYGQ